jgi:hypothetical protein
MKPRTWLTRPAGQPWSEAPAAIARSNPKRQERTKASNIPCGNVNNSPKIHRRVCDTAGKVAVRCE